MALTLIIFFLTIALMITSILLFPKIKIFKIKLDSYYLITILGAILLIILGKINLKEYGEALISSSAINPLKIIILFFSMTILSIFLDELGFFKAVAIFALNKANSSQFFLFTIFYFVISLLTIFTSNDIIILTFTPFICYFCKHAKINPLPYLISEFIAANTLSMALLIGNPTNIYLALSANITFISYFSKMFLNALITCLLAYLILLLIFNKQLKMKMNKDKEIFKLENKTLVIIGLAHLIICTIMMAISSYINIDMYLISLFFALSMSLVALIYSFKNKKLLINTYKRLPYALIPFLLSMFGLVIALNNSGFTTLIADYFNSSNSLIKVGTFSFISCGLINNIPMSVLFSNILNLNEFDINCVYSAIIGSNIGALVTPIGALAGIMWLSILKEKEVNFGFFSFIKYLTPISLVLMSVSLLLLKFF